MSEYLSGDNLFFGVTRDYDKIKVQFIHDGKSGFSKKLFKIENQLRT